MYVSASTSKQVVSLSNTKTGSTEMLLELAGRPKLPYSERTQFREKSMLCFRFQIKYGTWRKLGLHFRAISLQCENCEN